MEPSLLLDCTGEEPHYHAVDTAAHPHLSDASHGDAGDSHCQLLDPDDLVMSGDLPRLVCSSYLATKSYL